jgi:rare lipoprotein A
MFQPDKNGLYCPIHAALRKETPTQRNWDGGSTVTNVALLSRDYSMLKTNKSVPGVTRSLSATALIAATLLVGGLSEASAKSRKHHHHRAHTSHSWKDANAAIPSSGGGSFAGVASFYGNESGSKTASGQRFNENDMTAAHRSLPFGTKLRVTHRGKSVVVTINDRGPFIKGRVLDLSTGAARAVGLTASGVGHVTAEVM